MMRRNLWLVIAILLVALPVQLAAQVESADRGPRGISISGTGEVWAEPDVAYIAVGVQTQDKDATVAARENATRATAVIQAVKKAGIADKDIETTGYSVQPMYDYRDHRSILTGYQVSNTVKVTQRKLDKIGPVIDAAMTAGANNVQGVSFSIEDDAPLRRQALTKASTEAEAKAQAIAEALKVKLGRLLFVSESSEPIYRPQAEFMAAAPRAAEATTPISPKQLRVQSTVQVTYDILQAH